MIDPFVESVREMRALQQTPPNEVTASILAKKLESEKRVDAALKQQDDAAHTPSDPQLAMSFDEI